MWNLVGTGGVRTGTQSTMTTERTEPTDGDLVAGVRAGDDAAFGSADDAADIAQEAFVKAHRSISNLADPAMVRSWMLRIVANEAKNFVRGRARRRARDARFGSWVIGNAVDPESSALDDEDARRLSAGLGRIGTRDRQVLAYRYFAGLSEAETAAALGVALGTVKSRTARALARLRSEVGQR
jgi:RNA polymerase sigma factor (sigma-70 family)